MKKIKLTKIQYGIYDEDLKNDTSTVYNLPLLYKLDSKVDVEKFKDTIRKIIDKYEVLSAKIDEDTTGEISLCIADKKVELKCFKKPSNIFVRDKNSLVRKFNLKKDILSRFEIYETDDGTWFFMDIHHIIIDGFSLNYLVEEIENIYFGKEGNIEKVSFFDYIGKNDTKNPTKEDEDFYDNLLKDVETDNLPLKDKYDEEEREKFIYKDIKVREHFFDELKEKKGIRKTTFFTGAFSYLICKYIGTKEVVINTIHHGRNDDTLNTIGMFVRTMPFKFSYGNDGNIFDVLNKSNKDLLDIREHDSISYVDLAGKYGLNNDILFAYQGSNRKYEKTNEIFASVERIYDDKQVEETKLFGQVDRIGENEYKFILSFRSDMYTDEFAESFANAYVKIVDEFMNKTKFSEVETSDENEIRKLDSFFGETLDYDTTCTIVSMFEKQVEKTPLKEAVVYKDKTLTYKELNALANKYANYLKGIGVTDKDVVAILIGRSEMMPVLSIAASKTGATFMPMDPNYPEERLAFMLKDSDTKCLITTKDLKSKVGTEYKNHILLIDEENKDVCNENNLNIKISEKNRFIMLYTSGTTGAPKGVELLHENIVATIQYVNHFRRNDGVMRVASYASFGFDANLLDVYPPLTTGGTLYIIPEELRLDIYALRDFYNENRITHGFMTTQVGRQFIDVEDIRTLKEFGVGGEKLASVKPPKYKLYNFYGPTECSIFCTCLVVDKFYNDIPIGKPNANTKAYVVDDTGKRVPIGATGELLIAGRQVAKGYLNRPDKNKEAFIENPFDKTSPYDKMYRTGDLVRFLGDGNIQFVGRRDMQVKIRGFRIELSEVEEVIRRYKGIKDATVVAYDDNVGMKYLVAYVVSDEKVDVKSLNEFIMKEKPSYMVPAITLQIDMIPLNHNQKVNKRALPKPEAPKVEDIKLPANKLEEKIYDIVSSVVGNKNFGIDTDIFMAGLNSISVVRLNVLLSKEFDVPIRISDLKDNNTIELIEKFINENKSKQDIVEEKLDKYPITNTQAGIFVECIANPGATLYNIPILLKIDDSINVEKLKKSIEKVIDAHPYIKAVLMMDQESGDIFAKYVDDGTYNINVSVREELGDVDTFVKPYSILNKHLYRIEIIETHNEGKYLFVDMHHIISDGTSLSIFFDDVSKVYQGEKIEKERFTGFSYAVEEKKLLKQDRFVKAKEYYEKLLAGVDNESSLPKDKNEPEKRSGHLERKLSLDKDLVDKFCAKTGITTNAFFNAAFGIVLSKYDYKEDFAYATIYSGRNDSRVSNSICMLVKTFPVVCKYDKDTKVIDFLKGYTKQIFDSMTNDIYSFMDITKEFKVNADALFIYQGANFNFDSFCNKQSKQIEIKDKNAMEPLRLEVFFDGNNFIEKSEYRADLYDDDTIDGFMECVEAVANELMVKENVKDISLLSPRTTKLLDKYNDTYADVEDTTTDKAFEKAVEKYRDRIAVIAKDGTLTYDELNKRANKIANSLVSEGVKVDEFVGLMTDRTSFAYAARIGIMKSGGAFLAIDPKYPDDRVSYILSDSKAKILVTKKDIYEKRKNLLDTLGVKVLFVEDMMNNNNTDNPKVDIKPDNLAYCLYTSGSTGKPKGVMVEHKGVVNLATDSNISVQTKVFTLGCKNLMSITALTFDVSVGEMVIGLHNGLTITIATEEEITNPLLLCDTIIKNGADGLTCTPSYINNMLDIKETHAALRNIKGFQIGAETFPSQLYTKMRDIGIDARITNSYGPTEATDYTTTNFVESAENITIGRPLPNYKVFMFDKYDNLLPPKVLGELVISGIGVARGYVGREDLNKEKFFTYNGLRTYKSGDLAKWNYDGKIEFTGRMDNQVKLHGLRIELDEISNVINTYKSVKQSIAVVKKNSEGEEYLAAYFIASEDIDIDDLTSYIRKYLTEYMVPQTIMQLDKFPTNVNGKVDKNALPDAEVKKQNKVVKKATTELEEKIAEMFKMALNLKDVGIDEDFFRLGGTSLSASKIAMKAITMNIPITYADVFDYPTIEGLEKYVLSKGGVDTSDKKEDKVSDIKNVENVGSEDKPEVKEALKNNIVSKLDDISVSKYGDVLLTGCTGFLGIHVLKYLIDNTDKKIYCFIRKGRMSTLEAKLKNYFMYYFDDSMDDLFGKRLFLISGDITEKDKVDYLSVYDFDVVINCAACVKHFGADNTLYNVNVEGVKNLIDLCVKTGRKLIHISTTSVAGEAFEGTEVANKVIYENTLYFGQDLSNKYAHTKFLAEEAILTSITKDNLKAKIIRVGNLMSRFSDGEFQINSITNAFMRKLKAYVAMKMIPVDELDEPCEFSPIDCTAETIIRLSETNDEFTVYESYNNHSVQVGDVIAIMNKIGFKIDVVSDKTFTENLHEVMKDDKNNEKVSILISYDKNDERKNIFVGSNNVFTNKTLYRLGYRWPIINEDYIEKSLNALKTLGYFD